MNYLNILPVFTIMLFYSAAHAQKKQVPVIQWKIAGKLPASAGQHKPMGFAGPVAGINNDVLIVAGGANFPNGMPWQGGKKKYYNDVYVYRRRKEKLVRQSKTYELSSAIAYAASCSTPAGILYAGGENEQGISNKVIRLQWDAALKKIVTENLPDLPVALTNAAATVCKNAVYIAGGETASGVSEKFYCLYLNNITAGWKELPPVPVQVSHMVLVALSNADHACIYLLGGRKKNANGISDLYRSVYTFDPGNNEWAQKKLLPYPLTAGTGIASGSKYIFLFGGDKGNDFRQSELLAASIKTATDDVCRQQLVRKKNQLQASHPGFSKEVLLYNTVTDEWTGAGEISFPAQVTTDAVKWDDLIIIPGGEIRAGVRTPLIVSATINLKSK